MAQFIRPTSDITNPSTWNGTFADVDEATASDSDFGYSDDKASGTYETKFGTVTDPNSSSGHIVRARISKTDGGVPNNNSGNTSTCTLTLYQGTTLIATVRSSSAVTTWEDVAYTLSAGEADSITDYSDLRLRLVFSGGSGAPNSRRGVALSWAEMELPDYVEPSTNKRYFIIS